MAFQKITENVENISLLPDNPILSPTDLKAEFDKGSKIIKEKFNQLIDDLNNEGVGDTFPIGAITEYPVSESVPNNWLLCNGQAVSRIEYEDLFEVLGTTWGEGDGSTTFNVPNRAGLIAIGAGTHTDTNGDSKTFVLGQEYGEYNHTLTVNELAKHKHGVVGNFQDTAGNKHVPQLVLKSGDWVDDTNDNNKYTGGDQAHNNIQPSQATNFIIKARQSAGVSASVIQEDGTPNETDVYSSEASQELFGKTVLYESSEGTKGNVTLSDSSANYSYIEIFFGFTEGMKSLRVYNPNNKAVILDAMWFNGTHLQFFMKRIKIENNAINNRTTKTFSIQNSTTWTPYGSDADNITIYKVVGYK